MKYLKYILITLVALFLIGVFVVKVVINESRPEIIEGANATELAEKMLQAVDKQAWDTLPYIQWTFAGAHHFVWDRVNNDARVKWDEYTVHLDPDEITGVAFKGKDQLSGDDAKKAVSTAWSHWCNDMFWLAAPFKIKDKGVTLNVAKDSDGKEGLLVTYASGGVTPGDSYLWFLDQNGTPTGYKMWVKIIPFGGMYFSWDDWTSMPGGSKISASHSSKIESFKIDITNLKGGNTWKELGFDQNPIQLK